MKSTLSRLASRIMSFMLRGRRPRLDHPDAHRAAGPDQHAGLINHYTPSAVPTSGLGVR
ncbi:hypothetical protein ACWC9R_15120 [Streptomyces sp. NPDC001219]